ncbi:MAG: 1-acyl-sn-glycerol-3-phosphate acyltransferase [Lachnospiraceae bacterium]|nr:1-acyl-sn-glycerol-3-phosphate acyltransferase [Lachnospiraceae bacterium]
MIRSFFCYAAVVLYLVFLIPFALVHWILEKINPKAADRLSYYVVIVGFNALLAVSGVKAKTIGYEKVPKDEPVLYVGNHRSFFDIILIGSKFIRPTGFVAKKELGKAPLLSIWMKNIHCKFLDRNDMKAGLQMIMDCISDIKNGISVVIYPEGTRNKDEEGTVLPFHEGSLKIAEKSGCKIVPVAMSNTQAIYEAHFPFIKSTHVVVEYCDPIDIKTLTKEQKKAIGAEVREVILKKLQEHKENHLY